jgi:NTP pyrophosphatase (non-canonical NTP hydrolase)
MSSIREMQAQHKEWQQHNFPDQTAMDAFMGMVEETGEMSHALLKHRQGIRDVDGESVMALVVDALADHFIFSLGFANLYGIDLQYAIESTWDRVRQRDWIADPSRGGE